MSRFVIRAVHSGIKFDLKAANGQTIATSEVYTTAAACRRGIGSVRKNAAIANVEDQTAEHFAVLLNPKFELYQDKGGEFRFRLRSRNGKIIAVSEGYATRTGCRSGIESVQENAPKAEIMEE